MEDNIKIVEEVAIEELRQFLKPYKRKLLSDEEIKDLYPDVLEAIMIGGLVLEEGNFPKYTLTEPIKSDTGEVVVEGLSFKTRVLPSDVRKISSGVDIKKDPILFAHKCLSFVVGQPLAMLDKFSAFDYRVSEQLSTVFM